MTTKLSMPRRDFLSAASPPRPGLLATSPFSGAVGAEPIPAARSAS